MASHGIRDRVAIVGMGCTQFGEHWDRSADDLMVDAAAECFASTPALPQEDVDAYWLGTMNSGQSGTVLSRPLGIDYKPVTRIENMCATGSDAFRNACYAVASGAYDRVMALGVEKLKDTGYSGLVRSNVAGDGTAPEETLTAPAAFSLLDPAYCRKYGVDAGDMRDAMTHVAWKNHVNGAKNPRAQFRKEVSKEKIDAGAGRVAGRLGVMDCSGVSDGAACALIVRAEDAHRYTDRPMLVKALSVIAGPASGPIDPDYDYTTFREVVACAQDAYAQAGISDPRGQISLAEVHDCFTPTELVLMEDLGFSERGQAWRDELDGTFDLDGALPVNPDGGLKSFGHPVGASGLRMLFECWLQFRGEAGGRQLDAPRTGLTHNLGGRPGTCVSFISIVGAQPG
jgi:acetyl-CoA C-acetyltransferase